MSTLPNDHLEEGTIHAFLDGALTAPEHANVEAHLRACATCAAAVAEARGLIAGASRIVRTLDDAPMTPAVVSRVARAAPAAATGGSLWRLLRVTPKRAAIAATILVAVGVFATRKELGRDSALPVAPSAGTTSASRSEMAPPSAATSATPSIAAARPESAAAPSAAAALSESAASPIARDSVLESAIKRRLAISQPARALKRAPGVDIPQAPPPAPVVAAAGAGAVGDVGRGVAGGVARSSAQADAGVKPGAAVAPVATPAELSVASGRALAAQARDSAGGLAADQSRARVIGKVASSGVKANTAIQLRSSAPAAAPPLATGGLSGDWRGESTCQVHVPICEDERVVFHVIGSPSGYQLVMNRQLGTVEEYNALLECVLTPEGMECPTDLGVWRFRVAGDEMTGEFRGKDGVAVRAVKVRR